MPYIIDGHNLIPELPGLSLKALDDEMQLVEVLQEFCRLQRKQAEVFFDNAPPGGTRIRSYGNVTARFVRQGKTADDAIRGHLQRLGNAARNWTVVSSDLAVQSAARAVRAQVMSSGAFAHLVQQTLQSSEQEAGKDSSAGLEPNELDDWLKLFGEEGDEA
jgi:predicted RNA-binding protein with PIN domain